MRIAFLVVAHNEPQLLGRLLKRLEGPSTHSFVHVDAKVDEAPFRAACSGCDNVSFIEPPGRVPVAWGGFSIAKAIFNLAQAATAHPRRFDRYIVLSGADYPLRSLADMRAALDNAKEFIRVDRAVKPTGDGIHDWYVKHRFWGDNRLLNPRDAPSKLLPAVTTRMARLLPMPGYGGGDIYHGAAFFALTDGALRAIFTYFNDRPDLLRWFHQARSPVELVFHTALKGASYGAAITCDRTTATQAEDGIGDNIHGVHYIDWSAGGPHPKDLTLDDYGAIVASGALFARKMTSKVSLPLLDRLDSHILID